MGLSYFEAVLVLCLILQSSLHGFGEEYKSKELMRCKSHELKALLKFKNSFTKDPTDHLSTWVSDDCCNWLGVVCDNVTGNVVELNLRGEPLYYADDHSAIINCYSYTEKSLVSTKISSALLELKSLSYLDLSWNNFGGSRIPEFIGSMTSLRHLGLAAAGFSGRLPPQLGNLTNLIKLDLNVPIECYQEPHALYAEDLGWASNLSKLQSLDLSNCNLSQAHDTFRVLARLPSLSTLSLSGCELRNTHFPKPIIRPVSPSSSTFFSTLDHLDLSFNSFNGPLPSFFENIVSLQHLDLSANYFEGPFPSVLKNMISLRYLSLRDNNFNGSIPSWLKNMSHLHVLDLGVNEFSYVEGGMWGVMGNPCNFKYLDLSGNNIIQGDFLDPTVNFSTCFAYELEYLDLGYNQLHGSLPSLLGQLKNLKHLDLSNNGFQGQIPASFSNLSKLKYLNLGVNRLEGLIPDVLGKLNEIEHLHISSNSMRGTATGFGNLSKLSFLDTSFNNLNLDLGFDFSPPFQLEVFYAHSCKISAVFPLWLRNQTQIFGLDLSYSGISGQLPRWLWNMTSIQYLQLSGNQLTGSLPLHVGCDGCNLVLLDLHNNMFTGSIPRWVGHLDAVQVLDLSENLLTGAIFEGENTSSLLSGTNALSVLVLSDNLLSGEIQAKNVNSGGSLEILSLGRNQFTDHIPPQLCRFSSLQILELAENRLTGYIPNCLGSLQFDSDFLRDRNQYDSHTGLEIREIIKGITEVSGGTQGIHSMIDLSSNHLVGPIPKEITNISKLMALNLSYNHLTGGIPRDIGDLKLLESLDLSNNKLSGIIPESLSVLSWLSSLNLSNNKLYGPIPTGRQLQTLNDPSIYAGNSGLCGFPLQDVCSNIDSPQSPTDVDKSAGDDAEVEDKREKLWLYLVIMSGFATGFWVVVGTLVVNKNWRYSYFRFVEETADKVYVRFKVRMNRRAAGE